MDDIIKNVTLKRSKDFGYGFSVLGGAGSQLPPIIYDIIEGSPASQSSEIVKGDIIFEVNGKEVLYCTTKEVLNYLRLTPGEVKLKLKTDASLQERIQSFLKSPLGPDALRTAITLGDLVGVKHIHVHKSETQPTVGQQQSLSNIKSELPNLDVKSNNISKNSSSEEELSSAGTISSNDSEEIRRYKKKSDDISSVSLSRSPPIEDESDIESLHSFHFSPKAVDMPSVVRLAKRLYALDGFKKSDVSRHLSKNNEFSKSVAEEYLGYFNFKGDTLDAALRKFLDKFSLTGETQERERVLVHFSRRYLDCNPGTFNSQDAVHTLTCALMLLNTDLHTQNLGRKMTCAEFIDNLADLNDGENFSSHVLKFLYDAIMKKPLKWVLDDEATPDLLIVPKGKLGEGHMVVGGNPFLTTPMGSGIVYKKGYIMRKCCVEPSGKKTAFGKRSWKMWFCVIQDLVLYLHKDEQGARRGPLPQVGQNAVRLHHALAMRAHDYSKKEHVFRLQTADQAEYLLQTSDSKELQAWIDAINFVASSLSAPPMAGAVGSQHKFQRPLLPCSITKLNIVDQLEDLVKRLSQFENDLDDHRDHPPDRTSCKSATISNYKEKETYLVSEVKRYSSYVTLLRSRLEGNAGGSPGGPLNIGNAAAGASNVGVGALDIIDLPVFEVKNNDPNVDNNTNPIKAVVASSFTNGKMEEESCLVPPPIPDRPPGTRPTDRYSYQQAVNANSALR